MTGDGLTQYVRTGAGQGSAMTETDLIARIEQATELTDEELADELPAILAEIDGQTEQLILENPPVFAQVIQRMGEMDITGFAAENPETVDQFQTVLWTGMDILVRASRDVRNSITQDITVNFEATDAPMTGHLVVDADRETMDGGTDLLSDPDITIEGPANVLVSLITGQVDPIQGFMAQKFTMQGSIKKGTQLSQTMTTLTEKLPT